MDYIKLLGDKFIAVNLQSQVNEVHSNIAILEKFTELRRSHTHVIT